MATYADKLKDPRWQKRRLEILLLHSWTCDLCGSGDKTLHVHHGCYLRGVEPWNYPDKTFHVLCEACHVETQLKLDVVHFLVAQFKPYEMDFIGNVICSLLHPVDDRPQWIQDITRHADDIESNFLWEISF